MESLDAPADVRFPDHDEWLEGLEFSHEWEEREPEESPSGCEFDSRGFSLLDDPLLW